MDVNPQGSRSGAREGGREAGREGGKEGGKERRKGEGEEGYYFLIFFKIIVLFLYPIFRCPSPTSFTHLKCRMERWVARREHPRTCGY